MDLSGLKPPSAEGLTIPRSARGARREYCLAAERCISVQFVATSKGHICRQFPFLAAAYILSSLTFNPKVAGSNPARPTNKVPAKPRFDGLCLARHGAEN